MRKIRVEQSELQPVSADQMAELKALESVDVDCSDIPDLSADSFKNAVRGKFYKPLKAPGKGYQTRINAILRERMLHH
jgi:hypothetical protein